MPRIQYRQKKFSDEQLEMIRHVNKIIDRYDADGYELTLRQIYYQFVAKDLFPETRKYVMSGGKWIHSAEGSINAEPNYKWLGDIVSDGRIAGLIDWNAIVDRTRYVRTHNFWESPQQIIDTCARGFRLDPWEDQEHYIECWIEKDALVGIIERPCNKHFIPYFSCRGYTSLSEMWQAAQRLSDKVDRGHTVTILHLGDHDPSGMDMTRDINDRIREFGHDAEVEVVRLALNMDQVRQYNPPPNPAKLTDSRCAEYVLEHGDESWELDALDVSVIEKLIEDEIEWRIDDDKLAEVKKKQERMKDDLKAISRNYDAVVKWLKNV